MSAAVPLTSVEVRPMRAADLDTVRGIEQAAYPFPWSRGIFRDCLRVGYSCWVAVTDARVGGYGILSVPDDEAHILNLCVHPALHGRGLGRSILRRLTQSARFHRARSIYLEVRPSNRAARRLYDRAGFIEVGRRPNYYRRHGEREDALIMTLPLWPAPHRDGL